MCLSAADSSISTSFMRLLLFLLSYFVSDNGFGSRGIFLLCIGIGSSPGNTYFLEVICIGEQGEFEFCGFTSGFNAQEVSIVFN